MEIITNRVEWDALLEKKFARFNDIYYRFDYFNLFSQHFNARPEAVLWKDQNISVFWTRLVRKIKIDNEEYNSYDLTTPYGYGGPIIIQNNPDCKIIEKSINSFFKDYQELSIKKKYICEFVRFHPYFQNWKYFKKNLELEHLNDIIVVDLTKDLDHIWNDIRKGHRYNINKSIREGCEIQIVEKPSNEDIEIFLDLYYITMERNNASKKYFFPLNFIKDHFFCLNSTVLINVQYKKAIVGSSMFFLGNTLVHYHLSGTSQQYKGIYPSEFTIWEFIKWAKEHRYLALQLGGGRGKNDLLYNFKNGFSTNSVPFITGKLIFNQPIYDNLLTINKRYNPSENFFPGYRQGFNETII